MTHDDHSLPGGDDHVFAGEPSTPARRLARECLAVGVHAAQPARAVTDRVRVTDDRLRVTSDDRTVTVDLTEFDRLLVVGGGKAAAGLTRALVADLAAAGHSPDDGVVLVPAEEADSDRREPTGPVRLAAGGHPTPTAEGVATTREALGRVDDAGRETVVAAVDTDGRDGSTTAAGGIVDGESVTDPAAARTGLDDDDSLPLLADADCLLRSGPTGTNVNDLRAVVRLSGSQ